MVLADCREASLGSQMASPQQYGLWEVQGLGLVVAFRGTASLEDVLIDANIVPVPLSGTVPRGALPPWPLGNDKGPCIKCSCQLL